MICKNCGAEINNTMKFCNKCGSRIIVSQEVDPINYISQDVPKEPKPATANNREQKTSPPPVTNLPPRRQTTPNKSSSQANESRGRYAASSSHAEVPVSTQKAKKPEKSKVLAGILGIFLGYFGVHWFYLGKKLRGGIYLAITLLTATINENAFSSFAIFCVFEGIYFLCASKKSFRKYCSMPFKSITFFILLLIAFLIFLSSVPTANVYSENQSPVDSGASNQPQSALIETNAEETFSEATPTEYEIVTITPTENYVPEPNQTVETDSSEVPIIPSATEAPIESGTVSGNSMSFIDKQVEFATNHNIELYRFPSEETKLSNWIENPNGSLMYVDTDNVFGADRYKITEDYDGYLYYGELKDNRPHGYGILLVTPDSNEYLLSHANIRYILHYVGHFSDGQFDGLGLLFTESENGRAFLSKLRPYNADTSENIEYYLAWANYVEYFGEFSDGYKDGKGNSFYLSDFYVGTFESALKEIDIDHPSFSMDIGKYRSDELNGFNKQYIGGHLIYDGESKNGKYDGYGVLYYYGTNIPWYEGEFKNDMRHGTGTSYSETGEVIYKGKWKNDDYA